MPGPSPFTLQQTLEAEIAALTVASHILGIIKQQIPPGPPNAPIAAQLQNVVSLATSIQTTATQLAASGGGVPGGPT